MIHTGKSSQDRMLFEQCTQDRVDPLSAKPTQLGQQKRVLQSDAISGNAIWVFNMCKGANYCSVCWPKSTELSMAVYRQVQGCDCSWCRSSWIVMISEQASSQVSAGDCSCYISGSIGRSLHYSLCQHSCKMIQLHEVYKSVRHMVIRQATRPRYQYICLATKRLPTCTSFRVICI